MSQNSYKVYVAWDYNPELYTLTMYPDQYKESRLASLVEVQNVHHYANFLDSIKSNDLIELIGGAYKAYWKTIVDLVGFTEDYLYFIKDNQEYLIY